MLFSKYLDKHTILQIFNKIDPNIKFTLDEPDDNGWLPFLDTAVKLCKFGIIYQWYIKKVHSGNLLRIDSNVSHNTKFNFKSNRFMAVYKRSNNEALLNQGMYKMALLLQKNGYEDLQIYKAFIHSLTYQYKDPSQKNKFAEELNNKIPFKATYNNDEENKQIKNIVENTQLNLKLINRKYMQLKHLSYNPDNQKKCKNPLKCEVCALLGQKYNCRINRVVYKYTCRLCGKTYIGKTIVTIKERHAGHKGCFHHDQIHKSALAQHIAIEHPHETLNIKHFDLEILKRVSDLVNLNLTEGLMIEKLKPALNRKFEMTNFMMRL